MVAGSNCPALAATQEPWAIPSLAVACGASAWKYNELSVLCRERLWVVEGFEKCYRNNLNEWIIGQRLLNHVRMQPCKQAVRIMAVESGAFYM